MQRAEPPLPLPHGVGVGGRADQNDWCDGQARYGRDLGQTGDSQRHAGCCLPCCASFALCHGRQWPAAASGQADAAAMRTLAPGGSESVSAALPLLTASEIKPALSVKAMSSPGAAEPNVSR